MKSFRKLRDFREAHGHLDAARLGDEELARWSGAQRASRAKGKLSDERVAYLDGIGFDWGDASDYR